MTVVAAEAIWNSGGRNISVLSPPCCCCRRFPWDTQQPLIQLKYTHDGQDLNTTSTLLPSASRVQHT